MFEILKAFLFGIVEGITEWLPVSSTGHMILLESILPLKVSPEFYKMFEVVIQLGAILAVVILFWNKLWPFCMRKNRVKNPDGTVQIAPGKHPGWKKGAIRLWVNIIIACVPAAIVGLLFDDKIDELFYHPLPVAIALIVVGIAFIAVEILGKNKKPAITEFVQMTWKTALIIGLFQVLAAIFPGTSRSGATIIGALLIGVSREIATEFTFFLAVPVMLGASLLKVAKYVMDGVAMSGIEVGVLIVGCVVAFAVSLAVIKFLVSYIKKHDFKIFGYYRIVLGVLVVILSVAGVLK